MGHPGSPEGSVQPPGPGGRGVRAARCGGRRRRPRPRSGGPRPPPRRRAGSSARRSRSSGAGRSARPRPGPSSSRAARRRGSACRRPSRPRPGTSRRATSSQPWAKTYRKVRSPTVSDRATGAERIVVTPPSTSLRSLPLAAARPVTRAYRPELVDPDCLRPLLGDGLRIADRPAAVGGRIRPVRVLPPAAIDLEVVHQRAAQGLGLADRRVRTGGHVDEIEESRPVPGRLRGDPLVGRVEVGDRVVLGRVELPGEAEDAAGARTSSRSRHRR